MAVARTASNRWVMMVLFLQWAGIVSLVTFVGSLVGLPWLIGRLPPEYFLVAGQGRPVRKKGWSAGALVLALVRNTLGLLLFLAGVAMLVLPGQGVLTIIIGLSLLDLPGKDRLLARWASNRRVRDTLNWIRRRQGKEPFCFTRPRPGGGPASPLF